MKKIALIAAALLPALALAQDPTAQAAGTSLLSDKGAYFIAVAIAALGGTLGQGKAVAGALESIGRNPSATDKIFTPMILGLALIESLVIFTLITKFL